MLYQTTIKESARKGYFIGSHHGRPFAKIDPDFELTKAITKPSVGVLTPPQQSQLRRKLGSNCVHTLESFI